MKRILIVDDHPVVRGGLIELLHKIVDGIEVDEAGKGEDAIKMSSAHDYHLTLLDISLPDTDGLTVLSALKETKPGCPVIMLSIFPEEMYGLRALKAGASAYLTKEADHTEFAAAIKRVLEGGKYVSPTLAEILVDSMHSKGAKTTYEALSDREFQVISLIAAGKKPKEIAKSLCLSAGTVSTYRVRILKKLNMKSTAELVQYFVQNRLSEAK
jgi:DNA-binding NarL/FixJ family response regulator